MHQRHNNDIEAVMAASTSLVRPIRRLTPLGVVKG
jgi:hypothetical protein